jgi:uncharacterized Zn finger protein
VQVQGSNGAVHTVDLSGRPSCSCTAFKFRGACKHIAIAQDTA